MSEHLRLCIWSKLVSNDNIGRKQELHSLFSGLLLQLLGKIQLVFFNEGRSNADASCFVESENHSCLGGRGEKR